MEVSPDTIKLGRRQDRAFVAAFVTELAKATELSEDVLYAAAASAYDTNVKAGPAAHRRMMVNKAKQKLQLSHVMSAIGEYYEAVSGFSLEKAVKLHIDHIEGNITEQKVVVVGHGKDATTEVVEVKIPPNYAALRDLLKVAMPQPAKHLKIDQTHAFNLNGQQPEINPMPIGSMTLDGD